MNSLVPSPSDSPAPPRSAEWAGFVGQTVYDIDCRVPVEPRVAGRDRLPHEADGVNHRAAWQRLLGVNQVHGLYSALPDSGGGQVPSVAWETGDGGVSLDRALLAVGPTDNRPDVEQGLAAKRYAGLELDRRNAAARAAWPRLDGENLQWLWESLHQVGGVLRLRLSDEAEFTDWVLVQELKRLTQRSPQVRLILSYSAPFAGDRRSRLALAQWAGLESAVFSTAGSCDVGMLTEALQQFGPGRVLWGSDYPASERCRYGSGVPGAPLRSVESLRCLRDACEQAGLGRGEIEDIFLHNALRFLKLVVSVPRAGPEVWRHAKTLISGGTGLLSKRAEMFDAKAWPAYFSRCRGCEVWDLDGRHYHDFAGGIGAIFLGYADPEVTAAVRRRLLLGTYCTLVNPQEVELAEQLLALHPWAGKVRFARGGGEAMTIAVRVARAATGRSGVAFCGYHGWHDWYLAANLGDSAALDGHLLPGLDPRGVPRELKGTATTFRYNDLASFEAATARHGDNLAAVVMEPMRAQTPRDDFLQKVAAQCRARGAVLVIDEVTSGLRYGFPGAMARVGVEPDIAVYAKALSNGFPFGAVVGRGDLMAAADGSFISSSYWTDGVGPAAALAVLEKVRRLKVHEEVWARGQRLQESFRSLGQRHPACRWTTGGLPPTPTMTFDLGADAPLAQALFVRKMHERGFLVSAMYYLMLAHTETKIALMLNAADEALGEVADAIASGRLAESAGVPRGPRGFARLA